MKKSVRKRSIFIPVLVIIFTVIFMAMVFVWEYFYRWLGAYEDAQPQHYAEKVAELYRSGDIETLLGMQGESTDRYNTTSDFDKYISDTYGELSEASVYKSGVDGENIIYTVYTGNTKLCDLVLSPCQEVNEYGFSEWEVSMKKFSYPRNHGVTVCVPKGAEVYINDTPVSVSDRVDKAFSVVAYNDLDDEALRPVFETYTVGKLLNEPDVKVLLDGEELSLTEEDGKIFAFPEISPEKEKFAKEYSEKVAIDYALYSVLDLKLKDIEHYLIKESEYYRRLKTFHNDWYLEHKFTYSDVVQENIRYYDDDHFSIRISFTYHIDIGYRVNDYDVCYDMYFVRTDDGSWKLATMGL